MALADSEARSAVTPPDFNLASECPLCLPDWACSKDSASPRSGRTLGQQVLAVCQGLQVDVRRLQ